MRKLKKLLSIAMSVGMIATSAVATMPANTVSATSITFKQGDVNGDGSVTVADVTAINKYLNGSIGATAEQITRMDAVQNKVIEMQDYNKVLDVNLGLATAQTVTADVYTNVNDATRTYYAYDCDTNTQLGTYSLLANSVTANVNSRIFETYDDYVDDQNLNTVKLSWNVNDLPYVGSGFIIGDNLVATAAHCVYDRDNSSYVQDLTVTVYAADGVTPVDEYEADYFHIPTVFKTTTNDNTATNYDYALIYVKNNEDNENISQHGVWSLGCMTDEFASTGSDVTVSGFTGTDGTDKINRRYYSNGPIMTDSETYKLRTEAMLYGGKSGGPTYYTVGQGDDAVKSVIGINSNINIIYSTTGEVIEYQYWATRITPTLLKFFLNNPKIEYYANLTE